MAEYLGPHYTGIEYADELPPELNGFLFANEFFDALPVRLGTKDQGVLYELFVEGNQFVRKVRNWMASRRLTPNDTGLTCPKAVASKLPLTG